jgi:starch phosphorylase
MNGMERAAALSEWKKRIRANWDGVRVEIVSDGDRLIPEHAVGDELRVRARVHLGTVTPEDVSVELYLGRLASNGEFTNAGPSLMRLVGPDTDGTYSYESHEVHCARSGLHGFTVRVLPRHPDLQTPFLPGLLTWAAPKS